jgi:type I restriction enzyme M protein
LGAGVPTFAEAKTAFDAQHAGHDVAKAVVPVDGQWLTTIKIRNASGPPLEEYYKWQFISSLIASGLYPKDYIGAEVRFPKGNKTSANLKIDAAIFDNSGWISVYKNYWNFRSPTDLEWLNNHLLVTIEFKKNDKEIEKVFSGQVRAAMREREPSNSYVVGVYYDAERLWIFHRKDGVYIRFDKSKNAKGLDSKTVDLNLHLPDPYIYIPSMAQVIARVNTAVSLDRSKRAISDLEILSGVASVQVTDAFSQVLSTLDKS